ncbi:MAG: matrixin family metalloprotease, partial [Cyanobacteria bacterium P01_D01_bin.71]
MTLDNTLTQAVLNLSQRPSFDTTRLSGIHLNACSCLACCSIDQANFSSDGSVAESNFNAIGLRWAQPAGKGSPITITYSYSNLFDGGIKGDITANQMKAAIEEAFALWAQSAPVTFVEIEDTGPKSRSNPDGADIRIGHQNLGGVGGTLGRASLTTAPGELATTVVFDNRDTWGTNQSGAQIDFLEVAVHEIGHALGLDHESGVSAVMNPTIKGRYSGLGSAFLLPDDINGIQSLYGKGEGSVKPLSGSSSPSQPPEVPAPTPTPEPIPDPEPTPTP